MRILLTGHKGHIGSRAMKLLEDAGHEVIGFDKAENDHQQLTNRSAVMRAVKEAHCEILVHCAGIPHPKHGGLRQYYEINVGGSMNVFEAAATYSREYEVRRVIYASSVGFYGTDSITTNLKLYPEHFPIDESHPIASRYGSGRFQKLDAYNQSKVMAEQILAYYGSQRIFEAIALRFAPANAKSWQYKGGFTWQQYNEDYRKTGDNWTRGCFFTNVHPDYAAQAIKLAVEAPGSFWYEAFNITDLYAPEMLDVEAFLKQEYPDVPTYLRSPKHSLISCSKAMLTFGFTPCEDR